ncbi:hypothetical protein AB0I35_30685 [Nocardia sp. NPDC050378]|uniref:hypothetical protein n=1 Tax=Nocardia sp. NPDC050378 TaxID=3155400 RepID=UPI0033DCA856
MTSQIRAVSMEVRVTGQPEVDQLGLLGPLMPLGHRQDVGKGQAETRPIPVRGDGRVVPVQEDKVGDRPPPVRGREVEHLEQVRAKSVMHSEIGLRVAPAQVGVENVAGDLVRREPQRAGFDNREPTQLIEEVGAVRFVERCPKEGFGGEPDMRAYLQRGTIACARHRIEEAGEQRAHRVGRRPGSSGRPRRFGSTRRLIATMPEDGHG